MKVYSADEIRRVEDYENEVGTQFVRLMENAGAACAKQLLKLLSEDDKVCVVCGKGKNGGDGFVIARKLKEQGIECKVVLALGAPQAEDAVEMYSKAQAADVEIIRFDRFQQMAESAILLSSVIVDCIFGIGFHGEPDAAVTQVFDLINMAAAPVISIDVPSGVNTDTAEVCNSCIHAYQTFAITTLKPAHIFYPAREYCGKTTVLNIGISSEALESVSPTLACFSEDEFSDALPHRGTCSHKNDFGHVLVIAGSRNLPGAACLCSGAALYSGAGLVTAAFPKSAYPSLASYAPEVMLYPLPETEGGTLSQEALPAIFEKMKKATAIVMGCGLSDGLTLDPELSFVVEEIIKKADCPIVLDADGLNAIAKNPSVLTGAKSDVIITPHPGEMARLCGITASKIEENRIESAKGFADRYDVTVLLKGASTIVVKPHSRVAYVNMSGNSGLAKGGSGDVLSGIIGALISQGLPPDKAAAVGAFLHGKAADFAAETNSKNGMVASDLFLGIKQIFLSNNC